jgi:cytochrome P450
MTDPSVSTDTTAAVQPPPGCPAHADALVLSGLRYQQTPAELYRQIRRDHGVVAPVLLEGGIPAWLVLGYAEVAYVMRHDDLFLKDSRGWNQWPNIPADWPLMPYVGYQPSVAFAEGAEHQRRTRAIGDALDAVDQFELSHQCRRVAEELIDRFSGSGQAELISDYACALPIRVVVQMYGVPAGSADLEELVRDLRSTMDVADGGDPIAAFLRVQERMRRLVKDKRVSPGPDVISRMAAHPEGLTDEEIVQDLCGLMMTAQQGPSGWIGNTLELLLTDDRFALNVSGGRVSVGEALNEVLWLETPVQNIIGRYAARDVQLGGQQIKAGDCVVMGLAAANTDPQIWPDGHVGVEGNSDHLSFGIGEHRCPEPAPQLADVMARTAVETLLELLPDIMLAVEPEELVWRPSLWERGLTALPVSFTPVVR